jgi:hypothetical protein
MISYALPEFWELFWKLPPDIRHRARQAYRRFERDPNHPSLHFKHIKNSHPPRYSVRISREYRALGLRECSDVIVWYWIGTHTTYDKKV